MYRAKEKELQEIIIGVIGLNVRCERGRSLSEEVKALFWVVHVHEDVAQPESEGLWTTCAD